MQQQRTREAADEQARHAAWSGDAYSKLMAEGVRYASKEDCRKAARSLREAIALRPDEPAAYYNLGSVLAPRGAGASYSGSAHHTHYYALCDTTSSIAK